MIVWWTVELIMIETDNFLFGYNFKNIWFKLQLMFLGFFTFYLGKLH
jgi:hypothetical protein